MSAFHTESTEQLFRAIASLQSEEEARALLEDLCTIKEIQDMAQRLDTAILLSRGISYQKISEQIKVSTATISRVNRALTYGSNGYQAVITRLNETEQNDDNQ